jgi:energy-converting hydrogenase A subunit A
LAYIVAIIVSIVVALALRIPLLPSKPYRYSFDVSAIYPTPIIAIGVFSIFLVLNYTFMYNGLVLAIVIGILSALFVKYLFDFVFPKPLNEDNGEDIDE